MNQITLIKAKKSLKMYLEGFKDKNFIVVDEPKYELLTINGHDFSYNELYLENI